ncbi:hypothetical protein [Streptomyces sp. NPDC001536]|uniref:hypothetical protein n=1 Tax=Streptomyces sp. NPDC001536 TaxID=3364583 RepID=UPI00369CA8C1
MTDQAGVAIVRYPDRAASVEDGLAALLTSYHLRTEAEKGEISWRVCGVPCEGS